MQIPVEKLFEDDAQFEMTPMIDMVFLLLVFFMCASHMSTVQNVEMEIPTASKAVVPKERPEPAVVRNSGFGWRWVRGRDDSWGTSCATGWCRWCSA